MKSVVKTGCEYCVYLWLYLYGQWQWKAIPRVLCVCRFDCMLCDWREFIVNEFTCMVHTQSQNKADVEISKELQKETSDILRNMYEEVAHGRMVIPDVSNPSPQSKQSPHSCII